MADKGIHRHDKSDDSVENRKCCNWKPPALSKHMDRDVT